MKTLNIKMYIVFLSGEIEYYVIASFLKMLGALVLRARAETPQITESV